MLRRQSKGRVTLRSVAADYTKPYIFRFGSIEEADDWMAANRPSASIMCCIVATVAIGCRTMQISLNIISIGLSESHTGVRTVAISAVYKMYRVIRLTKMSETQWDLVDPKTPCTTYSHSKRSQASDMPEEIKGRWIRMSMKECRHWQEPSMIALADGQPLKRNIECTEVNCV